MDYKLTDEAKITAMNSAENKSFLLESINNYYDELIINNPENNKQIVNLLLKKMSKDSRFDSIDNDTKAATLQTGISCLSDTLKTLKLNEEKKIIKKENDLFIKLFLNNYNKRILTLKEDIKKNKQAFSNLKDSSKNLSLGQLANTINEFHNPNTTTVVSNQDVDDLLNGGTLEF